MAVHTGTACRAGSRGHGQTGGSGLWWGAVAPGSPRRVTQAERCRRLSKSQKVGGTPPLAAGHPPATLRTCTKSLAFFFFLCKVNPGSCPNAARCPRAWGFSAPGCSVWTGEAHGLRLSRARRGGTVSPPFTRRRVAARWPRVSSEDVRQSGTWSRPQPAHGPANNDSPAPCHHQETSVPQRPSSLFRKALISLKHSIKR